MGTAVVALALIGSPLAGASSAGLTLRLAGALLYLIGVFGITMAVNVPLNNRLAALDSNGRDSWPQWRHYLERWTWWNHVRALAGALASLALTLSAVRLG